MNRETALDLVKENISEDNLIKHMKAVEAGMRELASYFDEDEEEWGIAGLLHDLDYEDTKDDPDQHGIKTVGMLKEYDLSNKQLDAIKAHAGQKPATTNMEKAIYAIDPLTGLIVAGALVHPEGLEDMDPDFIKNRYDESSFAKSVDREAIASCEEMGFELKEFFNLVLTGMQKIQGELGL
ncbi:MAG: HDIG domain-containing metalloprotein [Candidatus Bipolaricaulota bacterium]